MSNTIKSNKLNEFNKFKPSNHSNYSKQMTLESLIILNKTKQKIPLKFAKEWLASLMLNHIKKHRKQINNKSLTVVFLGAAKAKKINHEFRNKNYATDILSFDGSPEMGELGELLICYDVIKRQSREHHLTIKEELGYMLIHGVLHLLGYEHEFNAKDAKKMFTLQDRIFDQMRKEFSL